MTTKADLKQLLAVLNRLTDGDYEIGYAYGRPRLLRAGGSVDVSPRLPRGQLVDWMRAYIAGIEWAQAAPRKTEEPLGTISGEDYAALRWFAGRDLDRLAAAAGVEASDLCDAVTGGRADGAYGFNVARKLGLSPAEFARLVESTDFDKGGDR